MNDTEPPANPSYAWVMAAVTFSLTALSFGVLGSVGVFLKPLAVEFGWSRGDLSLGYTAITLSTAASTVIWGIFADRYGARWIALFGASFLGICLLLLSQIETKTQFYIYYVLNKSIW